VAAQAGRRARPLLATRYSCHLRPAPLLALPAAFLLVASLLCGCGASAPALDTVTVERAIATSILTQHHLYTTVRCPSRVPRRAGFAFTCTASLNVGTYRVAATETNDRGHVEYRGQTSLVTLKISSVEQAIRQSISTQRHLGSTVTCPSEVLQRAGIVFTCTALARGRSYPFEVTEIDGDGHVRYIGRR
jgi:hypothetical protein